MRYLFLSVSLLALAACEGGVYDREAGGDLGGGNFGNSTMNNTLVQNGELSVTVALQERFAGDVNSMVTFDFNSATLTAQAQSVLARQADWIRQFPEVRFRVYGHTDLVGSNGYNKALGLRRAKAVVAFLGTQGISVSRLEAVASFGETQPVVATQNPEQRNRRTVTEVVGFVNGHPTVMNGRYAELVMREYVEGATYAYEPARAIESRNTIWPTGAKEK